MLRLPGSPARFCDGLTRRDWLRVGSLGAMGLSLPSLLRLQETHAAAQKASADSCILVFLWGAPSQYETYDPKPNAPDGIRGEFGVIPTRTPGVVFGEHIPLLAQRTDKLAIVRTCAQTSTHHQSAAYEALTGFPPSRDAVALTATTSDHPNVGSVVSKYVRGKQELPRFVQLPEVCYDVGNLTPGQYAGFLGRQHDPLVVQKDPNAADFNVQELTLRPEVAPARLEDRQALLKLVDQQAHSLEKAATAQALDTFQDRALRLLTSPAVKKAFDVKGESAKVRDRYGRNPLGQSCLLARRLSESGVRGEFGRTPRINAQAGRDHWEKCYSILMAGGGVKAGQCYGQSDRIGAYPTNGRVSPADMTATIYHTLGIDHTAEMTDQAGRPIRITSGEPMVELF